MISADTYRLLAAIRAFPAEDTPRLALADCIQEEGHAGAAAYIREGVAHHHKPAKKPRRIGTAREYIRWLESLFGLPPTQENYREGGICGGETWDSFHWRAPGYHRSALMHIERGLPHFLSVTCPMLMEQSAKLFLFPLTGCEVPDRKAERDDMIPGDVQYVWTCRPHPSKWNTWEDDAYALPDPLWRLLPLQECPGLPRPLMSRGHFTHRMDANSALNAAALAFGRAAVAEPACENSV